MTTSSTQENASLSDLTTYVYGTTGLGNDGVPRADRIKVARAAMDAGVWFHTSDTYGSAMSVLNEAFKQDPAHIPNMIFKVGLGANTVDELRGTIVKQLTEVGVDRLQIGQLCISGAMADDYGAGGKTCDGLRALKEEGIVDRFVLQVFPHESENPLRALRAGHLKGLVDAFIFYLNPLQRYATNPLWDAIQETDFPFIAMRTVCGGNVHAVRSNMSEPEWLRDRAGEVAPIFERSDCKSWTEFCVRFTFGFRQTLSTVGSTIKIDHLQLLLNCVKDIKPLPADIQSEIVKLQYSWSETDVRVHSTTP